MEGVVKIHGKEYKTVALRVNEFRAKYPITDGWAIVTKMIMQDQDKVICSASIVKDGIVLATGFAEEVRKSSHINKTSALENCETSAIGRCLSAAGFAGDNYASADEVAQAISQQNQPQPNELEILQAWGRQYFDIVEAMGFAGQWGEAKTLSEHKKLQAQIKSAHSALQEQQNNNEGE